MINLTISLLLYSGRGGVPAVTNSEVGGQVVENLAGVVLPLQVRRHIIMISCLLALRTNKLHKGAPKAARLNWSFLRRLPVFQLV